MTYLTSNYAEKIYTEKHFHDFSHLHEEKIVPSHTVAPGANERMNMQHLYSILLSFPQARTHFTIKIPTSTFETPKCKYMQPPISSYSPTFPQALFGNGLAVTVPRV
jgi:hypothetical protein